MVKKAKVWFKARMFGLGWYPSSKEGWAIMFISVLIIILSGWIINQLNLSIRNKIIYLILIILLVCIILSYISYKRGEKPFWAFWLAD